MKRIVGKCNQCGGNVTVPTAWYGTLPPIPTCESCYSTAVTELKTIKMNPRK